MWIENLVQHNNIMYRYAMLCYILYVHIPRWKTTLASTLLIHIAPHHNYIARTSLYTYIHYTTLHDICIEKVAWQSGVLGVYIVLYKAVILYIYKYIYFCKLINIYIVAIHVLLMFTHDLPVVDYYITKHHVLVWLTICHQQDYFVRTSLIVNVVIGKVYLSRKLKVGRMQLESFI